MLKRIISIAISVFAIFLFSFPSSAATLTREYIPEKYINVSGNYYAKEVVLPSNENSNDNIYKFVLSEGQTVLVDVKSGDASNLISLQITNDENKTCAFSAADQCSKDGRIMCAYTAKDSGEYFVCVASDLESESLYDINISFFNDLEAPVSQFPFSSYFQQGLSQSQYLTYSFELRSGDAFALETDINYSYILFNGIADEISGTPAEYYNDSFYGFCGIVPDSCIATVFVPFPCSGTISADILPHSDFVIEDITLPIKDESLNLKDAVSPFDDEQLKSFTAEFGENVIDNRPLKYFRFYQNPNQVVQLSAEKATFDSCKLVCGLDSTSPLSGQSRMEQLHSYENENGLLTANIFTRSTGNYMLAVRNNGEDEQKISLQTFEAFSATSNYKPVYEYGETIDSIEIKNLFVDINIKDENGELLLPSVSCIKLIDDIGIKSYYSVTENLQPAADHNYSAYAVISHAGIDYQVYIGDFRVEKTADPVIQPDEPSSTESSSGLTWWMITLIVIGGFCLLCCLFLLVYKKDINEVK